MLDFTTFARSVFPKFELLWKNSSKSCLSAILLTIFIFIKVDKRGGKEMESEKFQMKK